MFATLTDMAVEAFVSIDFESPVTWGVIFVVGLFAVIALLKRGFNMIEHICNRTYIYNICWEDPAVDHEILKISNDDVIFRICSAGDIVLDYAIEGPAKIVVCDMNQHQLYLFELKIRMLRDPNLTYEEWWAVWGSSDAKVATKVWKRMRHTMSSEARAWWDPRIESTFRNGFATSGSTGLCAKLVIPLLVWVCGFDIQKWAETVSTIRLGRLSFIDTNSTNPWSLSGLFSSVYFKQFASTGKICDLAPSSLPKCTCTVCRCPSESDWRRVLYDRIL